MRDNVAERVVIFNDAGEETGRLRRALTKFGRESVECHDIKKVIEETQNNSISAFLFLPSIHDSEGIDSSWRRMKGLAEKKRIPVIVLTSKNDKRLKDPSFVALGDDFLFKPYPSSELLLRIKRLTGKKKDTHNNRPGDETGTDNLCQSLLRSQSDGYYLKGASGRYLSSGGEYRKIRGIDEEDLLGKADIELHGGDPDKMVLWQEWETEVKDSRSTKLCEVFVSDRVYEVRLFPVTFDRDRVGVGAVIWDITAGKRARMEVDRLASFAQLAPIPIVEVDSSGLVAYANPAASRLFSVYKEFQFRESFLEDVEEAAKALRERKMAIVSREKQIGSKWYAQFLHYVPETSCVRIYGEDITETKEGAVRLLQSEKRFRSYIENSTDIIMVIGSDNTARYVSPSIEHALGYTPTEIVGTDCFWLIHPDDRTMIMEKAREAWQGSDVDRHPVEVRYHHKDGSWRLFESVGTVHIEESGDTYLVVNARDVTDRRIVLDALQKNEKRFRTYLENASDLIVVVDLDRIVRYASPSLVHILGYTPEEVVGKTVGFTHPDDMELLVEPKKQSRLNPGIPTKPLEIRNLHKDGSIRYLEMTGTFVVDESGESYTVMNCRDTTERRLAEDTLRATRLQLEAAVDLTGVGYWEVDVTREEFVFSNGLYALLGTTAEREGSYRMAASKYFAEFVHPDDMPLVKKAIQDIEISQLSDEDHYTKIEHRIIRRDGEIRHITSQRKLLRDSQGHLVKVYGAIQDITERKVIEENLLRSTIGLAAAMELAHVASWERDLTTGEYIFNDALYSLLGTTAEQEGGYRMPMKTYVERFFYPEDIHLYEAYIKTMDASRGTESDYNLEHRIIRRDGEVRHIQVHVKVSRDADNRIVAIRGALQDITERIRMEEAFRSAEALYRMLAENISDTVWLLDPTSRCFTYVSPSILRLWGIEAEELLCKSEGSHDETKQNLSAIKERLESLCGYKTREECGKTEAFEVATHGKDGSLVWTETVVTAVRDKSGQVVNLLGVTRDISERKRAEEALRASRLRLEIAIDLTGVVYWEVDEATKEFIFNDAFYALYATTAKREGGYRLPVAKYAEFVHPDDLPLLAEMERSISDPSQDNRYATVEHRIIRRDGAVRYITAQRKIVRRIDGSIEKICGANQDITDRKEVEESLRLSHLQLEEAMELAHVANWELDLNTGEFIFNDAFYAVLATTAEAEGGYRMLPDIYVARFFHPDDIPLLEARNKKIKKTEGLSRLEDFEHRVVRRDGEVRHIVVRTRIVMDESGATVRVYGTNQDITERKTLEDALRRNSNQLAAVMGLANVAGWDFDHTTEEYIFNDAFYKLLGTTVEKEGGYRMGIVEYGKRFFHPDDLSLFLQSLEEGRTSTDLAQSTYYEHRIIRDDGEVRHIAVTGKVVRDVKGRIIQVYGANQDITDRVRMEKTIRESESRYRMLAENMSDMIWSIDPKTNRYTYISPSCTGIWGYTVEELVELAPEALLTPSSRELIMTPTAILNDVTHDNNVLSPRRYELEGHRKDGSVVWVEVRTNPIVDNTGRLIAFQGVTTDITERKRAEEALRTSELQLSIAANLARVVYWELDEAAGEFIFNDSFLNLLGTTAEQEGGYRMTTEKYLREFILPDETEMIRQSGVELRNYTPIATIQHRIVRRDDEIRHVLVMRKNIADESDRIIKVCGAIQDITDRVHMEEALRTSEARYRMLAENMSDMIWSIDPSSLRYAYVSPSCTGIWGFTAEELMEQAPEDVLTPVSRQLIMGRMQSIIETLNAGGTVGPQRIELEGYRKDGSTVWVEIRANPIIDEAGRFIAFQGVSTDITERKKVEDALRISRFQLLAATDLSKVVYWEFDAERGEFILNDPFFALLSTTAEAEGGYRITINDYERAFVHPDDAPWLRKKNEELWVTADIDSVEFRVVRRDGQVRHVVILRKWITDELGEVVRVYGAMQDITDFKRVEGALRESESRYRMLAENMSDMIWSIDPWSGRYTYVSSSCLAICGYTPEEIMEQSPSWLLTPASREIIATHNRRVCDASLKGERLAPEHMELETYHKDGSIVWLEVRASGIYDETGRLTTLQGITRDVTERKKTEEALRVSQVQLSTATELTKVVYWEMDKTTGQITLNDPYYNLLATNAEKEGGYQLTKEELRSRFVHPDDMAMLKTRADQVEDKVDVDTIEYRLIRGDGVVRHVLSLRKGLTDSSGHVVKVYGALQDITERKEMEEALRRSEEQYRMIADNASDMIWVQDPYTGQYTYASPSSFRITGYTPEEITAHHTTDVVGTESLDTVEEHMKRIIASGKRGGKIQGDRVEVETICKDGRVIWVESVISGMYNDSGKLIALQGVTRDITERKRMEEALRISEEKYRTIFENAVEGIFQSTPDGRFLSVNPAMATILGYETTEELVSEVYNIPEQLYVNPEVRRTLVESLDAGEVAQIVDLEWYRKDRATIWVTLSGHPVYDEAGRATYYECIVLDITERKRMEEALRISEEKYRTIFENAVEGIFQSTPDGRFLSVNPAMATILGYETTEELMTGTYSIPEQLYVNPEARGVLMNRLKTEGILHDIDLEWHRKDGTLIWVTVRGHAVFGDDKEVAYLEGTVVDITERKRAQELLALRAEELARSNKELEQFAYIASHDLQEPLRMVASYTELLGRRYVGKLDADADEFIGFAIDGATRMKRLINDLLAYSRVGTKGKPFVAVELNDIVDFTLSNLKMAIEDTGAQITRDNLPRIVGDDVQLVQLFQNLISNAVKFRGATPPKVHVGAVRDKDVWVISVQDNGIGIDPQYFERIFVIFQRLHSRHEYSGTGIGLAVCKRIVERHGGHLWVESEPGQGATFKFSIPEKGGGK